MSVDPRETNPKSGERIMKSNMKRLGWSLFALALGIGVFPLAFGRASEKAADVKAAPVILECYYRAKWGFADEFFQLYKKNHLPVMRKLQEEGRILKIEIEKPRYHATEDSRWDYRVTLTFRDAASAHDPDHEKAIQRELYKDQDAFQKAEARRFEVLQSHWDVIVDAVDPDAK